MGRFLLLLVAGLSLAGITYRATDSTNAVRSSENQASAEEVALARGAAQSGFDVALGELSRDLDARPAAADQSISSGGSDGSYSLTTTVNPNGSLQLISTGAFRGTEYEIEAEVLELLPTHAGIVVHGKKVKIEAKDNVDISGHDLRSPSIDSGAAGPAPSRPAIGFTDAAVRDDVVGEGKIESGTLSGSSDTGIVAPPAAAHNIAHALVNGAATHTYTEYKAKETTLGSPSAPVALYASKKAELGENFVGYGVLVVDGELKMEKGARWEGLIIVRAASNKTRKVEIKDGSQITGGLVLLGTEFETESDGDAGFVGGHMDLDIFEGSGIPLDRSYHQHEWDDKNDLTYLDFFTAPDLADSFNDFLASHFTKTLRVEFINTHNATGTYEIGNGGAAATGRIENGFNALVPFNTLNKFRIDFDALCALRGSNPGRVKSDGVNRDGSFTVRFWDGATLIYAVGAYEHAKTIRDGDPTCGAPAGEGSGAGQIDTDLYGEFEVKIEKNSGVQYSEEAMGLAGRSVPAVRSETKAMPLLLRSVPLGQ